MKTDSCIVYIVCQCKYYQKRIFSCSYKIYNFWEKSKKLKKTWFFWHFWGQKEGRVLLIEDFFALHFWTEHSWLYKTLNVPVDPLHFIGWRLDRSPGQGSQSSLEPFAQAPQLPSKTSTSRSLTCPPGECWSSRFLLYFRFYLSFIWVLF